LDDENRLLLKVPDDLRMGTLLAEKDMAAVGVEEERGELEISFSGRLGVRSVTRAWERAVAGSRRGTSAIN
jgi:hypothetical protein